MKKQLWIACYDVRDAKRLRRVARIMESLGNRVQKSVFECWLDDADLANLLKRATTILEASEDTLRLYALCETCIHRSEDRGKTAIQRVQPYYII